MKELITTQLIEECHKRLKELKQEISEQRLGSNYYHQLLGQERMCARFITSLQSKQPEERQNVVDAFEFGAIRGAKGMEMDGESYFNDNFKTKK